MLAKVGKPRVMILEATAKIEGGLAGNSRLTLVCTSNVLSERNNPCNAGDFSCRFA
jgi:hypothetical protein